MRFLRAPLIRRLLSVRVYRILLALFQAFYIYYLRLIDRLAYPRGFVNPEIHFGTPQNAVWDVVKLNFTTSQTMKRDYMFKLLFAEFFEFVCYELYFCSYDNL